MKLHFYGTSDGIPTKTRVCSCTILEVADRLYAIDAGAPLIEKLTADGKKASDLKAIFTTHTHNDHTNGIYHYISLLSWYYQDHSLPVHITEPTLGEAFKKLYLACDGAELTDRVKFVTVDKDFVYDDGFIKVSFIPTAHLAWQNRPSYSILVEAEGKRILFSGDFSNSLKKQDVPTEVLKTPLDAFVCELAHFSFDELAPYLKDCKAKKIYFNHIATQDKYEVVKQEAKNYPFEFITPNDGDVFEI